MMKEEFEARTNFAVTPSEYRVIEKKYATDAFGHCNKDEFCKLWVERGGIKDVLQARKNGNIELPYIKRYTNKELMELVVEKVKKTEDYKKAEAILDYFLPEKYSVVKLANYEFAFHAIADFGGSEGIFLNCWLKGNFDNSDRDYCQMGTFKTLKDDLDAMKIMAELGGILNFHVSQFVNQNINSFTPEDELKRQAMYKAGRQLELHFLHDKYRKLLEKGKDGSLTSKENEDLLEQIRRIEGSLDYIAAPDTTITEELEHEAEI